MLLFRQKYPRWWFDWNLELSRFSSRVGAYFLLMDDQYPSTDEHQSVHLDYPEVTGQELNRWLPLVKWLLAIPHYVVLFFLAIATHERDDDRPAGAHELPAVLVGPTGGMVEASEDDRDRDHPEDAKRARDAVERAIWIVH
jgi:hypothetical protein